MDQKKSKKLLGSIAIAYWILAIIIYLVAGTQFRYLGVSSDALSPTSAVGELVDGMTLVQSMTVPADRLDNVEVFTTAFHRTNNGVIHMVLEDENGNQVAHARTDASAIIENGYTVFVLEQPLEGYRDQVLTLTLTTEGCEPGNAVSVFFGNTVVAGRFDIAVQIADEERYLLNDEAGLGKLCIRMNGIEYLSFYKTYWVLVIGLFAVCTVYVLHCWKQAMNGINNPVAMLCNACNRYTFLIRQLVARDFKTKYKRSVLGMAWSFLNPLLTMAVQYVVFSTLFRSDTANYPVYLLSGIVLFSFFSEAVSMGMTSITGNAPLINKVYVPKYIFPVSRVLSSLVNLGLSLIPLLLVMAITGTPFRPALLLLIFDLLCLLMFVTGMVLLMATSMVFFRDTQFLWGVVSMLWMYLTPLFYPENIIPVQFLTLYHLNPMYQYITFARTCIISGVSPAPASYLWCLASSVVVLGLGLFVFRKHQDKFVLYM